MATTPGHALFNLDRMLVAFLKSEKAAYEFDGYGKPVTFVPARWDVGKSLPLVIVVSDTATRTRAKNWDVSGRILVRTPLQNEDGNSLADQSTALELAIVKAFEDYVPADDRPQPLCAAINAVATAQSFSDFMLTNFRIADVSITEEEEEFWEFTINFRATVLNDSNN